MVYDNIGECDCRTKSRVLTTFKVSEHLTYLICLNCNKKVGEWTNKVKPEKSDFSEEDKERLK
ncbi:MAG: hypothetical protein R3321_02915 [Nitrososphaeraceae archaeon]|nr:hypothetical protein [Nitrososphaeraceae archaeon]